MIGNLPLQKTDVPGLAKDPKNKAVLNVNQEALLAYRKRRDKLLEYDNMADRINKLEERSRKQEEEIDELRAICVELLRLATDDRVNFNG